VKVLRADDDAECAGASGAFLAVDEALSVVRLKPAESLA